MTSRSALVVLAIVWFLGPLCPSGLLFASGFVRNTATITNPTAQQVGWITLLILGIAALGLPFYFSYHRFNHIWEASPHVRGGACYRFILASISVVLLTGTSALGFFSGFWFAAPRDEHALWRTRWIITLSFALALYVAALSFDIYIMYRQDSETVDGERLPWDIFTTATLPTHRQAEVAANNGRTFYYPTINHTTHDNAHAADFNLAGYYDQAAHMNMGYGGRYRM
ncbi:hypothetical protein CC85DRAFT_301266 [Cutaneotrichosporon oleaginosum]|uniref:Uncharacterized protein n=1 Tax=Cutaneotrichosporon oleaginosum TaxID=879819 RepID=A0A0J0XRB0_9TREE|nr:uncharacterized protein CC85DRAFT_301266 [Cutaneotrichosporon oleaginosum]KLT43671.1 hypothetical protein CC85DRAFT_301266 [Cutaneotrichosporon oleaginosum]TXT12665.1 hypothetical protein COLE_03075 [Cutaneotrichosporon oleaginosum]